MKIKKEFAFKMSVVGSYACGKTSLITKYVENQFSKDYKPTLGASIIAKDLEVEHKGAKIFTRLVIWDIAGQEKYETVRKMYFQGAKAAIFVYDITRRPTFEEIKTKWIKDFKKDAMPGAQFVLIGNKKDLEETRNIPAQEGEALAKEIGAIAFFETSAKTGENVNEMFELIVKAILEKAP